MNQVPSIYGGQRQSRGVATTMRAGIGQATHPRISIQGAAFTLIDAGGDQYPAPVVMHPTKRVPMLMCIIVGANGNKSKMFYPEKWGGPEQGVPPLCFSDNGIAPSSNSQQPQAVTCTECYFNKWGSETSALTGKGIKACQDKKKIAVQVLGDTTGMTYELQIPPASLKELSVYCEKVMSMPLPGGERATDVMDVVTAINFVPQKTGLLEFEYLAWVESVYLDANGTAQLAYNQNGIQMSSDGGWGIVQRIDHAWESGVVDTVCGLKDIPWQPGPYTNVAALPGMTGQPTGYMEQQAHGGALQRGSVPGGPPNYPQPGSAPPLPSYNQAQGSPQGGYGVLPAGGPSNYPQSGGPHPSGPYAPPPGMRPSEPVQAFRPPAGPTPHPGPQQGPAPAQNGSAPPPTGRGGARAGAGRKPRTVAPAPSQALAPPQPQVLGPGNVMPFPGAPAPHPANPPGHVEASPGGGAGVPAGAPASPNFGMQPAGAPPPELEKTLAAAFSLKTET